MRFGKTLELLTMKPNYPAALPNENRVSDHSHDRKASRQLPSLSSAAPRPCATFGRFRYDWWPPTKMTC